MKSFVFYSVNDHTMYIYGKAFPDHTMKTNHQLSKNYNPFAIGWAGDKKTEYCIYRVSMYMYIYIYIYID